MALLADLRTARRGWGGPLVSSDGRPNGCAGKARGRVGEVTDVAGISFQLELVAA